jgi:hypothetical protein
LTEPIQSLRRGAALKRVRGGRRAEDPPAAEQVEAAGAAAPPAPASPTAPISLDPGDSPPVLSAQILGQSHTAETDSPANLAGKARAVYLGVEWSGPSDRRNRRGRIAKTDI